MNLDNGLQKFASARLDHRMKKISALDQKSEKKTDFDQKLKEATQEFESLFVHHMLKTMRSSIPKSEFWSGGNGEEIFRDMLDQELAQKISKRGIGISDTLFDQIRKNW